MLKGVKHNECMRSRFTSATCRNCNTDFDRIPVEYDEDGGYAVIPVKACAQPNCSVLLCPCCDQFHCDGCGDTFCADHLVSVPDGTDRPLHCCPACAEECEPMELPFEPVCPEVGAIFERGSTIADIEVMLAQHRAGACLHCAGVRKSVQKEVSTATVPASA
jgi:hypothetical protein